MLSRNHELVMAIRDFVIAGMFAAGAMAVPEGAIYFGAVGIGAALTGVWSLYRACEGREREKQAVGDVRTKIAALRDPEGRGERPDTEQLP